MDTMVAIPNPIDKPVTGSYKRHLPSSFEHQPQKKRRQNLSQSTSQQSSSDQSPQSRPQSSNSTSSSGQSSNRSRSKRYRKTTIQKYTITTVEEYRSSSASTTPDRYQGPPPSYQESVSPTSTTRPYTPQDQPPHSSRPQSQKSLISIEERIEPVNHDTRLSVRLTPELIPSIANPPIPGDPAPDIQALQNRVNDFGKQHGFAVGRYHRTIRKQIHKWTLVCDRGGKPPESTGLRQRKKPSKKTDCPWMIYAESERANGWQWVLRAHPKAEHSQHNHGPSLGPEAHPLLRRLNSSPRAQSEQLLQRVGVRARDVIGIVEDSHPDTIILPRDMYNLKARMTRSQLDGHSPTGAVIKWLQQEGFPYIAKWDATEPDRLVGLVWTFPECLEIWRRFPEVLSCDNTYNTNRYKMPLFQVTGKTCLETLFNAAFGVIDNEKLDGFEFLVSGLRALADQHKIRLPDVVITDYDTAMKTAIEASFPDAESQLCIQHINRNVALQANRKWVSSSNENEGSDTDSSEESGNDVIDVTDDENQTAAAINKQLSSSTQPTPTSGKPKKKGDLVLQFWHQVMFAETEDQFQEAWIRLCEKFAAQQAIILFLNRTYIPVRSQWARCFIKHYRNFGTRTTSGTESSNHNVKTYLLNGMGHLYKLAEAVHHMAINQLKRFEAMCAQDEINTSFEYRKPSSRYLGELPNIVSKQCLKLITAEYARVIGSIPTRTNLRPVPLGECVGHCSVSFQMGIPCCHTISVKMEENEALGKWDVHHRWHLRKPEDRDPYRRILDPNIVTQRRGRPRKDAGPLLTGLSASRPQQSSRIVITASQTTRRRGRPPGSRNKNPSQTSQRQAPQPQASQSGPGTVNPGPRRRARPPGSQNMQNAQPAQAPPVNQSQTSPIRRSVRHRSSQTTGVRQSGRRLQPSVRRDLSRWEQPLARRTRSAKARPVEPEPPVSKSPEPAVQEPPLRYSDPRAIYRRYTAARDTWRNTQQPGTPTGDQDYRKAIGLPPRYPKASYNWCLNFQQMGKRCTTSTGSRAWTHEEMTAYLDWDKREDGRIDAQVALELQAGPSTRRGTRDLWRSAIQETEDQQALFEAQEREQPCIVVEL